MICLPSNLTSLLGSINGEAESGGILKGGAQRQAVEKRDAITIKSLAAYLSPLKTSPFLLKN